MIYAFLATLPVAIIVWPILALVVLGNMGAYIPVYALSLPLLPIAWPVIGFVQLIHFLALMF